MRFLYDARIEDLGDGDFLGVECAAFGYDELIPRVGFGGRLPAAVTQPALDLQSRFQYRSWDTFRSVGDRDYVGELRTECAPYRIGCDLTDRRDQL
jgi:hypothetical protein